MIIGPGSVQFSKLQKRLNKKLQISVERFQHEPLGSEDWVTTPYVTDVKLYCIVLYCIALHCIALHCIVLYCIVSYRIVSYCIVLYCIVLYCIVLCCIVLCCIVLHHCQQDCELLLFVNMITGRTCQNRFQAEETK